MAPQGRKPAVVAALLAWRFTDMEEENNMKSIFLGAILGVLLGASINIMRTYKAVIRIESVLAEINEGR